MTILQSTTNPLVDDLLSVLADIPYAFVMEKEGQPQEYAAIKSKIAKARRMKNRLAQGEKEQIDGLLARIGQNQAAFIRRYKEDPETFRNEARAQREYRKHMLAMAGITDEMNFTETTPDKAEGYARIVSEATGFIYHNGQYLPPDKRLHFNIALDAARSRIPARSDYRRNPL